MKKLAIFISILFFSLSLPSYCHQNPLPEKDGEKISTSTIAWMENLGQFDKQILFATRVFAGAVTIDQNNQINYFLKSDVKDLPSFSEHFPTAKKTVVKGRDLGNTKVNFFKGNKDNHRSGIATYSSIAMGELWEGISLEIRSERKNIEKIFTLHKGADPNDIRIAMEGITDLCVSELGELQVDIEHESMSFSQPLAWQVIENEKVMVSVSYHITTKNENYTYGFQLGQFNPAYPITIDPLLASTYLGGSLSDNARKLKIDANGKVYVCGITESVNFPGTITAYDQTFNDTEGENDLFIARFSSDLAILEVCTFLGGNTEDVVNSIDIDANGNIFIVGETESRDFPTTPGAFDLSHDGNKDYYSNIYVAKLNNDLNQLLASTFIGTYWSSDATALAIDHQNQIYIAGESGGDLPMVGPQFQDPCEGVFVIKINNTLTTILASNSIDGSITYTRDMKIGPSGNIFVTGVTRDVNNKLPTTPGCYDDSYDSGDDIFILKLDQSLANNLACTYLGGNNDDEGWVIEFNDAGNVIIGGKSLSSDYPTTLGVYDETWDNTDFREDGIISILSNNLKELLISTYIGAHNADDGINDLYLNDEGKLFILGNSRAGFPVFCNSILNGGFGVYLAIIDQQLQNLETSTYLNGWRGSTPGNFEINQNGNIVVCGATSSNDFPVLNGYDHSFNSDETWIADAFLSILTPDLIHGLPCCTWIEYPTEGEWGILPFFTIDWEEAKDADGYYLSIGTEDDIYSIHNQMDLGNVFTYDITDLPCGETIIITIDAYNENGIAEGTDCISSSFHTINPTLEVFHDTICEGDVLDWEGFPLYYEGRFRVIYESQNGCDSTLQMNLTVLPSFFNSESISICEGESYEWFSENYSLAGSYYQSFNNDFGCDSIYELILDVIPGYEVQLNHSICEGEIYDWEGQILTDAGTFTASYLTEEGCDSTINLNLSISPVYAFFDSYEMCDGDSLIWHGQILKESGTFSANYLTEDGCDSIYNLEMTIYPEFEFFDEYMICEGEELEWHGNSYSSTGNYSAIYSTKYDCDSTYYLTLLIKANYTFEESANLCPGEKMIWHDQSLDSPGDYQAIYTSQFGCDSSYYLSLSQTQIDTTVTISGDQFDAVYDENAIYQWLRCPDFEIIEGAQNASYLAEESGTYAILIEKDNCLDTSSCHHLIHSALTEINEHQVSMYPNPVTKGRLEIAIKNHTGKYAISIIDLTGKELIRVENKLPLNYIDVSKFPSGVYFVTWENIESRIVRKIIIQN